MDFFSADTRRRTLVRALLLISAGACGLAGLLLEHGFRPERSHDRAAAILTALSLLCFLAELLLSWRHRRNWRSFARERWPGLTLTVLLLVQVVLALALRPRLGELGLPAWLHPTSLTRLFLSVVQFYVIALLLVNLPRLHGRFAQVRIRPGLSFLVVFLVVIVLGAGLLRLPAATPPGAPLSLVDAFFTSTSAVCVTGLIVRDTATEFTRFGQCVILILIQLGGLGIMSLAAALALMLGRGISIRERSLMREAFQVPLLQEVGSILRFIVLWTLITEAIGAVLLFDQLAPLIPDAEERWFVAVFHAVSAFCNAGFSTYTDSLLTWSRAPVAIWIVAALLVIGGLGFTVVLNMLRALRTRGQGLPRSQRVRLRLQTRIVLIWSAALLVGGAGLFLVVESSGALAGLPWSERLLHAVFQAATCRTAGFNTLDLTTLAPATLLLLIALMFVGGGSGSTAGGVKLNTVAVIGAEIRGIALGRRHTRLFGRELGEPDRHRATVVITTSALLVLAGAFALLLTERADFLVTLFETVSAMGTVGLSLGLTAELSTAGKIVVMILMYVGRVGVLTFTYGLVKPTRETDVRLPRGDLMIG